MSRRVWFSISVFRVRTYQNSRSRRSQVEYETDPPGRSAKYEAFIASLCHGLEVDLISSPRDGKIGCQSMCHEVK